MGQILGITGVIGSGKTTFARLLCTLEPDHAAYECSELVAELADDFNKALSGELAFETATDNTELVNQALIWFVEAISEKLHYETTWNHLALTQHQMATHPELFEKIFNYLKQIKKHPDILDQRITATNKELYRPLLQWLGGYLVAKVSDTIWFDEIFRRIGTHDAGKKLVVVGGIRYPNDAMVVREHGGLIVGLKRADHRADTADVTESSQSDIKPDILVHNNGTPRQLQALASELWNDLTIGRSQPEYLAA